MPDLLAARSQMGVSLAFHIVFAVIGIAMPVMMVVAERRWQVTGHEIYHELAQRWAKGTAILFAVGAVSGTVLSFELGLLWPGFMRFAGAIIGMPFSLEGFAFFTEAIFLGVYLYGWDRVPPPAHLGAGLIVAASGALSGIFVVIANAWMNAPAGFALVNGQAVNVDPIAAMANSAALEQTLHMTLAAYAATGFAVAGVHAFLLLKDPDNAFHRRALTIALMVGAPAAVLQPLSGDLAARNLAVHQPVKLAAAEALFTTQRGAPLTIGGWPDVATDETRFAIRIPYALSLLAFHDPHAEVQGLDAVPRERWPNVRAVHFSFDLMVGLGSYMALVALWAGGRAWRRADLAHNRWLMRAIALATPAGFIAIEAGWMVTELGRQPWVIYGVMKTRDAVTPMPGLIVPFLTFTLLYCFLGVIVGWLLYRQILRSPDVPEWRGLYMAAGSRERGMTLADILAGIIFVALNAYALLARADFGGGVSALLARAPRQERQRELIADAIGPVWEANHVWLILAIVLLFTCFPPAFARLGTRLHIPLSLVLIGIVLRGSAFTFWRYGGAGQGEGDGDQEERQWGMIFAVASLITPLLLGTTVGAIASGGLGEGGRETGDGFSAVYVAS